MGLSRRNGPGARAFGGATGADPGPFLSILISSTRSNRSFVAAGALVRARQDFACQVFVEVWMFGRTGLVVSSTGLAVLMAFWPTLAQENKGAPQGLPERSETAAAARCDARVETLAREVSLPLRNGEVLAGYSVIGEKRFEGAMDRLGRLLMLSGRPELVDRSTMFFASMLPRKDLAPFSDARAPGQWKGAHQFERDDTRKAFLGRYRERIMRMCPKLPLVVGDTREIYLRNYDAASGTFGIEIPSYDPWPSYAWMRFEVPMPYRLPTTWQLSPDAARRVLDGAIRANGKPVGIVLLRNRVDGVRPSENGVVVELTALDITVFADRKLRQELGRIPLPAGAVRDEPASPGSPGIPYIDPSYASIVLASLRKELLADEAFLREAYAMRRIQERNVRAGRWFDYRPEVASWPLVVPGALLSSNAEPTSGDLARFRNWLETNIAALGDEVRFPGICSVLKPGECAIRADALQREDKRRIDLARLVAFNGFNWDHARLITIVARSSSRLRHRWSPTRLGFTCCRQASRSQPSWRWRRMRPGMVLKSRLIRGGCRVQPLI